MSNLFSKYQRCQTFPCFIIRITVEYARNLYLLSSAANKLYTSVWYKSKNTFFYRFTCYAYVKYCRYMFVYLFVCSGLTTLSTIFQSHHNGVWLRLGAQCSLLLCCLTEVSCPGHLTWYHTQSHYPDTEMTSPSSPHKSECQARSS